MRVLVVTGLFPPNHVGGYEIACASFVEHLRASGHAVRVLAAEHPPAPADGDAQRGIFRELRWYKDEELQYRALSPVARLGLERANLRVLRRHFAQFTPEVVNWWAMGGMSLSLIESVRRAGLPAIGMVSDAWMLYGADVDGWTRPFRTRPGLGALVERLSGVPTRVDLGAAATWSFVSEHLRAQVTAQGIVLPRTLIGRTGINSESLAPAAAATTGVLLYAGRVARVKGVDLAVRALAELPERYRLRVLGPVDAGYGEELRAIATHDGTAPRIAFETAIARAELAADYQDAEALLFPVRWEEPWGLVPLEAMACGTPVIATGTGGSAEYLRHEENCLLIEREDHHGLALAVRRLAGDPALRATIRAGGLETAARFSEHACNLVFERQLLATVPGAGAPTPVQAQRAPGAGVS